MIEIDAVRKAMDEIAAKKGPFGLIALVTRTNGLGPDLLVSAPWLEHGNLESLGEFIELVREELGDEFLVQLSRIATLPPDDPTFDAIVSAFPVDDGELRVRDTDAFKVEIDEAVILRAKRVAA